MSPLPRFDNLPEEKQHAILQAAANEFAEHEGGSFNRIIAAAGISKGAMYYYFADKADVYGAVLDHVLDRMAAVALAGEAPRDAEGFWLAIAQGLERLNKSFFAEPQLAALARGLYQGGGSDPATYRRLLARSADFVERVLARGQELGAVRDDLPRDLLVEAVTGLLVAVDRWFAEALAERSYEELLPPAPKVFELMLDLLEPRGATR